MGKVGLPTSLDIQEAIGDTCHFIREDKGNLFRVVLYFIPHCFVECLVLVTGAPGEAGVTPSCPETFRYQGKT